MGTERPWYLYIVLCEDSSLYTGVTRDLQRRLHEHNHSNRGARYTRGRRPVRLIYFESASSRSAACKREYVIKQLTTLQKNALILDANPADLIAGGVKEAALNALTATFPVASQYPARSEHR